MGSDPSQSARLRLRKENHILEKIYILQSGGFGAICGLYYGLWESPPYCVACMVGGSLLAAE